MLVIDRELLPGRLWKVRRHSSWVPILAVVLFAVLILSAIAGLIGQLGNDKGSLPSQTPVRTPARILFTAHTPILIVGNGNFTTANGVVSGSGVASDPYTIEEWDINATNATGIQIQNTTASFVVRSCLVYDGRPNANSGIFLMNCTNGTLVDNTCFNNQAGIGLESASNITLISSNCSNNQEGILLVSSNNNYLDDNNCSNDGVGIVLGYSSNNNVRNNTCSDGSIGVSLTWANDNILYNNTCLNSYFGIEIDLSNGNNLIQNNCSLEQNASIVLFTSDRNVIVWNQLFYSQQYGLFLGGGSTDNDVYGNVFNGNHGAGSTYNSNHVQAYDNDGTGNRWNASDGHGNYWSDWTTPDANHDGIVDQPYVINGSAGARDFYPQTPVQTQIPEFGMMPLVVIALMAVVVLAGETRRKKKSCP